MNDLQMTANQSNVTAVQQPGRFALFAIGCMIEIVVLILCSAIIDCAPYWMWVTYPMTFLALMIVQFGLIRRTGFFDYKSSSLCLFGYSLYLLGYLLICLELVFSINMSSIGVIDKGIALMATILIVVGLLKADKQSKGQPLLRVVLYLFVFSQLVVCIGHFLVINQYLYLFLKHGLAILFLFAIFNTCYHTKRGIYSWLQKICANLIVLSAFNLIVYCIPRLLNAHFGSAFFTGYILAIVFFAISLIGGVMALKPDAQSKIVRTIVLMVVAILAGLVTKTESWDPAVLSYLLIVSAAVYLVSFLLELICSRNKLKLKRNEV